MFKAEPAASTDFRDADGYDFVGACCSLAWALDQTETTLSFSSGPVRNQGVLRASGLPSLHMPSLQPQLLSRPRGPGQARLWPSNAVTRQLACRKRLRVQSRWCQQISRGMVAALCLRCGTTVKWEDAASSEQEAMKEHLKACGRFSATAASALTSLL